MRKNDLPPPGIQIGKAIFNQPPVHLGTAVGSRRRHCAQPDRLAPAAGAFCRLIRYRYIIGALCVYYSCSLVSACVSRSCFSKIAVITYLLTLIPALFAHSCKDSLLTAAAFCSRRPTKSVALSLYFLFARNCAALVLFSLCKPVSFFMRSALCKAKT